jgi:hypothetical protein
MTLNNQPSWTAQQITIQSLQKYPNQPMIDVEASPGKKKSTHFSKLFF